MDRRTFLTLVGVSGVATNLPLAFASISSAQESSFQSKIAQNGVDDFVSIGTLDELNQKGQILDKKSPIGSILIVPNTEAADGLSAVNPTCTHEGCTVKWEADKNYFECPCHDAQFAIDGALKKGPAKEPLATYEVKVDNNTIFARKNNAKNTTSWNGFDDEKDEDDDDYEREDD
jgi:cytochrome b6-f complex iron-sulfur subunit